MPRTFHLHIHDLVPKLIRQLVKHSGLRYPGIVDKYMYGAEILHARVDDFLRVFPFGHVALNSNRLSPQGLDHSHYFLRSLLVARIIYDDVRALLGKGDTERASHAPPTAGYDCVLPFQLHGDLSFSL